jgi:hypothetical protein
MTTRLYLLRPTMRLISLCLAELVKSMRAPVAMGGFHGTAGPPDGLIWHRGGRHA